MISDLVGFFLLLLFGAMIINGFFNVTRGSIKILPDGTAQKDGQIFRGWYFFWYREKEPKILQYKGKQMDGILAKLRQSNCIFGIEVYHDSYITVNSMPDARTLQQYAAMLDIMIVVLPTSDRDNRFMDVVFRKEEKQFVFPWWLRKMMAGCIPCHSSWLGSIIYWTAYNVWGSANNSTGFILLNWAAYCISLAFLSPYLWKKIN